MQPNFWLYNTKQYVIYLSMIRYAVPQDPRHLIVSPQHYYIELADASYALGMLQVAHGKIANAEHLIKPLLTREATLSSKMEGTITDSKDVFVLDATGKAPNQDTVVVANYRAAMMLALNFPGNKISNHKIRQLHQELLAKTPHKGSLGQYRKVDAWIGKSEDTPIEDASYVAAHPAQVQAYMDNLVDYINNTDDSPLIKTAVFHYTFEAIHPFEDGNGRIGRMLVPTLLNYQGQLSAPVLYTSEHFEKNAVLYRQKLHEVDVSGDLTPWIQFFLRSLKEQCQISIALVNKIVELNDNLHQKYINSQSPNMTKAIDYIFEEPVFTIPQLCRALSIHRLTASALVKELVKSTTIRDLGVRMANNTSVFYYPELLKIIN